MSLHLCVFALILLLLSCGYKQTDMRFLVPAETLVYIETKDLADALQPIVDSKPFTEVAKSKPDFSVLKGVQLAVAVTGFETSEEKLTDEDSIGHVQPHFVAVAETHAWNYQAVAFAEKKLGAFVAHIYDSEPTLEKSDKNGGKYFTWTAKDGRKAFALVTGSLIYFGNDESAIEKCLAVKRGESDNIAKTRKISPTDLKTIASGYVSTDGIAQIANIAGLKFASEAGDGPAVQSAIAAILPRLLRSSITEIHWSAAKTEAGIEDKYQISMPSDIANVFNKTMAPLDAIDEQLLDLAPANADSVTQYNLKNPQLAWRSILQTAQKVSDPLAGKMFAIFVNSLFEPYGIKDGEMFLNASFPNLITVRYGDDEGVVVVSKASDREKQTKSLSSEFIHSGGNGLVSKPGFQDVQVYGDPDGVLKYSQAVKNEISLKTDQRFINTSKNPAVRTKGIDRYSAAFIVEMLSEKKSGNAKAESTYFTETRFTKTGIERRTVSDFGLIGSIIAQLAAD